MPLLRLWLPPSPSCLRHGHLHAVPLLLAEMSQPPAPVFLVRLAGGHYGLCKWPGYIDRFLLLPPPEASVYLLRPKGFRMPVL
jgi:hypothetical protein